MEESLKIEIKRKVQIAKNVLTHKISFTHEDSKEIVVNKVLEYLKKGYEKNIVKSFELYKVIDEETFAPQILIIMNLQNI